MSNGWGSAFTWVLVFVGWCVVHQATLARDRRKEKRDVSARFCSDLLKLQADAIDFHTADKYDSRKSHDVAQQVDRIVGQLTKVPLVELNVPYERFIALRQAITMNNSEASDFKPQPLDALLVFDIRNAVMDLVDAVEEARETRWP